MVTSPPGSAVVGVMRKQRTTACSAASLIGSYAFEMSGETSHPPPSAPSVLRDLEGLSRTAAGILRRTPPAAMMEALSQRISRAGTRWIPIAS
jgi:hypothetical protein